MGWHGCSCVSGNKCAYQEWQRECFVHHFCMTSIWLVWQLQVDIAQLMVLQQEGSACTSPHQGKHLPAERCCEDLFSPLTDSSMERPCCSTVFENCKHVIKFQWIPKQARLKLRHQSLWPQSSKTLQCMNKPTLNSPMGKSVGTTHCFKLGVCSRDLFDVGTVPHSKCCLNQSLNPVYHVVPLWRCWFLTRQSCSFRLGHLHFKSNVKNF